jgi:hypothetical protein
MGKDVSTFVPLKYASGDEAADAKNTLLIALGFGAILALLYRSIHGKGSTGKKTGSSNKKNSGGMMGGGGLGDLMNMNKSGA